MLQPHRERHSVRYGFWVAKKCNCTMIVGRINESHQPLIPRHGNRNRNRNRNQ